MQDAYMVMAVAVSLVYGVCGLRLIIVAITADPGCRVPTIRLAMLLNRTT